VTMQDEVNAKYGLVASSCHGTRICVMEHGASVLISARPTSMPG